MNFIKEIKKTKVDVWQYIACAFLLSWIVDTMIIFSGESVYKTPILASLRMWAPGIVGVLFSIKFKNKDVVALLKSIPKLKYLIGSYIAPIVIGIICLGLLALIQITELGLSPKLLQQFDSFTELLFKLFIYTPTIGILPTIFASIGEELGWRGYLLPRTENLSKNYQYFFNGFIWSVYHWPLIIFSDYATSSNFLYSLFMFSVFVICQGFIVCWIQEKSKSLWTSVILHASHNMWVIGILPVFYRVTDETPFYIGEGGLFLTLVYMTVTLLILFIKKVK